MQVGGDVGSIGESGEHEVQHESIALDAEQAIEMFEMCQAAHRAAKLLETASDDDKELLAEALKQPDINEVMNESDSAEELVQKLITKHQIDTGATKKKE
jgi:hypothetical protein